MAIWSALGDLLLPTACAGCARPGEPLCGRCVTALTARPRRAVPTPAPAGLPPIWAAMDYAGIARAVLVAHKEHGRIGLVRPLGDALAATVVVAVPAPRVVLVPVPSSPAARRARGYDHALRLARRAAWTLCRQGVDAHVVAALTVVRRVADQAGLTGAQRAVNLAGALGVRRRAPDLLRDDVVVVDDVLTTGATLSEAARVLRVAGARVSAGGVVAATVLRSSPGRVCSRERQPAEDGWV